MLQRATFVIAPRQTIIYDSAFYQAACGGFGGLLARPHHIFGHYGPPVGLHLATAVRTWSQRLSTAWGNGGHFGHGGRLPGMAAAERPC